MVIFTMVFVEKYLHVSGNHTSWGDDRSLRQNRKHSISGRWEEWSLYYEQFVSLLNGIRLIFTENHSLWTSGLEIISQLAPVKLSGQTYFYSDITHFLLDKYPLCHISVKFPSPLPRMMFTYQTSTFSTPLLYMQPLTRCKKKWNARYNHNGRQNQLQLSLQFFVLNFNT